MAVTNNLVNYVKKKEGFRSKPYWDVKQWSYGYGQRVPGSSNNPNVRPNVTITESEAEQALAGELNRLQSNIGNKYAGQNWNQNQLDSLTSFAYNLGEGAVDQVTANGQRSDAVIAAKMLEYKNVRVGGSLVPNAGLEARRGEEAAIFQASDALADQTDELYASIGITPVTGSSTVPPATSSTTGLPVAGTLSDDDDAANLVDEESLGTEPAEFDPADLNEITPAPDVFTVPTTPRPNRFKDFATMTYSISLYILGPEDYKRMMLTGKKSVKDLILFMQSGGIRSNTQDKATGADVGNNFGAKRSKHFMHDFYIDDVQLEGLVSGTSAASASNVFKLDFKVTEPAGLTFIENMYGLVHDYQQALAAQRGLPFDTSKVNYAAQTYLMVIRFYGYDIHGNQITPAEIVPPGETLTDKVAIAEKFIPFMFTNVTFELTTDKVEYACNCVCPQSLAPMDYMHARIPFNMNFQGNTVKDILIGKDGGTQDNVLGLVEKLNEHQEKLRKKGNYEYADRYEIHFEENAGIEDAKVLSPGTTRFERTGFESLDNTTAALLNEKVKKGIRTYDVRSGMGLIQFIDLVLRTSTYISTQYEHSKDENTDTVNPTSEKIKSLVWFKINCEVELGEFDKIRNDYSYVIKYVISRYKIDSLTSPYFTAINKDCFGIHKEYNYWFTGENTEVLKFNQKFDYLWYTAMGAYFNPENLAQNNLGTIQRRTFQTNPGDTAQGGENASSNPAADAASDLYSPGDQAIAEIEIVGDPDFICQSELFFSPLQRLNSDYAHTPFLQDGSVNYDASEVFFTINYNTVVDYNLDTGLADTLQENLGRDIATGKPGLPKHQFVYRANTITTKLVGGAFTQILDGTMMFVPEECVIKLKEDQVDARAESNGTAITTTRDINGRVTNPNGAATPTALSQFGMGGFANPSANLDILSGEASTISADQLVINNNVASDRPQPENSLTNVPTTPPAQPNPTDAEQQSVNDDAGILSAINRGVNTVVNTTQRVTGAVFDTVEEAIENRTENDINDFQDGG